MNFPGRKSLAITMVISTALMMVGLLFTNAHNSPLDELGCHKDPPQGKYHCHTGALKGKEFANKDDAERAIAAVHADDDATDFAVKYEDVPGAEPSVTTAALEMPAHSSSRAPASQAGDKLNLPPPPEPSKAVVHEDLLKIVSWKVKKREKMDVDRIANVLAEVDLAVLHDLDLDEVGRGPLHKMGDVLQARIGEKICRMWFKNASGGKEKIGVLWRNSTIAQVESGGAVKGNCGEMAVIVPTVGKKGERVLATSLFYSKKQKKMFMLGAANFESKPGNLISIFKSLESSTFPTIVVGDLKTPVGPATVELKKSYNFKTAIASNGSSKKTRGSKSSTENYWTKNATAARAVAINLYERFSEIPNREVDGNISDSFPVLAEVELVPEGAGDASPSMTVVPEKKSKKDKEAKQPAPKAKVVSEAKVPEASMDDVSEDLEREAGRAESTDKRLPASVGAKATAKKPIKKKKKH